MAILAGQEAMSNSYPYNFLFKTDRNRETKTAPSAYHPPGERRGRSPERFAAGGGGESAGNHSTTSLGRGGTANEMGGFEAETRKIMENDS